MDDLVEIKRGVVFTTSNIIAEEFGLNHIHVNEKIDKLTIEYSILKKQFIPSTFTNKRGQTYPCYHLTRDGFMTLVMQMGGAKSKKARDLVMEQQQRFIIGFNQMEKVLLRQSNDEFKLARSQGKIARKEETDTIKTFVEYAKEQGSSKSEWYYKHFTNATYKALALLEHNKPKTRDTLDLLELNQLYIAENIISKVIQQGMDEELHYKAIYELCKQALISFADTLMMKRLK